MKEYTSEELKAMNIGEINKYFERLHKEHSVKPILTRINN